MPKILRAAELAQGPFLVLFWASKKDPPPAQGMEAGEGEASTLALTALTSWHTIPQKAPSPATKLLWRITQPQPWISGVEADREGAAAPVTIKKVLSIVGSFTPEKALYF
ncbi:hypothetical protein LF599_01060 [Pseudodesulfovibrio thermohalotolerans]|uniref:hypothetical protein n=1 Tax=Pseudodesulfovibrio thermohalotolerans TaxID=2880651 RepID=UPI002442FD5F|nr:hypothetical protein [Pseudodesulfovibrio thermohalotolerans]WFS62776.1 hypothetical protein LF599_01060 [Pseudodesulfovibrio thermohalotolerans]